MYVLNQFLTDLSQFPAKAIPHWRSHRECQEPSDCCNGGPRFHKKVCKLLSGQRNWQCKLVLGSYYQKSKISRTHGQLKSKSISLTMTRKCAGTPKHCKVNLVQEWQHCEILRSKRLVRPDCWVLPFGRYSRWLWLSSTAGTLNNQRCIIGFALPRGKDLDHTQTCTSITLVFSCRIVWNAREFLIKLLHRPAGFVRLRNQSRRRCKPLRLDDLLKRI